MIKTKQVHIPAYGNGIQGDVVLEISKQCYTCKHVDTLYFQSCKAFPKGIPTKILTGKFDHTKKYPEQKNNILFENVSS